MRKKNLCEFVCACEKWKAKIHESRNAFRKALEIIHKKRHQYNKYKNTYFHIDWDKYPNIGTNVCILIVFCR